MRKLMILAASAISIFALGSTPVAATGGWQQLPPATSPLFGLGSYNMEAKLPGAVQITDREGWYAKWVMSVVCPAGERFHTALRIDQLGSPLVPSWVYGEDYGVPAVGQQSGVCTGSAQRVIVPLAVVPTRQGESMSPPVDKMIPLVPSEVKPPCSVVVKNLGGCLTQAWHSGYFVALSDGGAEGYYADPEKFLSSWCNNPGCAEQTNGVWPVRITK